MKNFGEEWQSQSAVLDESGELRRAGSYSFQLVSSIAEYAYKKDKHTSWFWLPFEQVVHLFGPRYYGFKYLSSRLMDIRPWRRTCRESHARLLNLWQQLHLQPSNLDLLGPCSVPNQGWEATQRTKSSIDHRAEGWGIPVISWSLYGGPCFLKPALDSVLCSIAVWKWWRLTTRWTGHWSCWNPPTSTLWS